jgi:hypothetical protein
MRRAFAAFAPAPTSQYAGVPLSGWLGDFQDAIVASK